MRLPADCFPSRLLAAAPAPRLGATPWEGTGRCRRCDASCSERRLWPVSPCGSSRLLRPRCRQAVRWTSSSPARRGSSPAMATRTMRCSMTPSRAGSTSSTTPRSTFESTASTTPRASSMAATSSSRPTPTSRRTPTRRGSICAAAGARPISATMTGCRASAPASWEARTVPPSAPPASPPGPAASTATSSATCSVPRPTSPWAPTTRPRSATPRPSSAA